MLRKTDHYDASSHGYNAFWGSDSWQFVLTVQKDHLIGHDGSFHSTHSMAQVQPRKSNEAIENPYCGLAPGARTDEFKKIPGSPVAYWVSDRTLEVFVQRKASLQRFETARGHEHGRQ